MKCDIVIAVWNKKDLTRQCIESIARNTRYPYRLIIIDNASDKPTQQYLQSLRQDGRFQVLLIRNEENLGNTKAVNQGLKASTSEFVCNLDNDTLVTKGWLEEMVCIANFDKSIGLVIPSPDSKGLPKSPSIDDIEAYAMRRHRLRGQFVELGTAVGFCVLIKREVIAKTGVWDERFSPGYFDDAEYSMRASRSGFKSVCAKGAFVYHREHSSFKHKKLEDIFRRNRKIYYSMYGEPRRILYIVDKFNDRFYRFIERRVLESARQANWVWVFVKSSLPYLRSPEHGNIKQLKIPDFFFIFRCIYRILMRQKKKFDLIYVNNGRILPYLKILRFIYKAKVEKL